VILLRTLGKKTDKFLEISQNILYDKKGKIFITPTKSDSYFDFDTNVMGIFPVKYGKKVWLETYIHEYCHFLQKYYKTNIFKKYMERRTSCYEIITSWIFQNKIPPDKQIKEAFHLTRMLEHECEQMSASLVREFDLPVDTRRLQKKGNAYLIFYHAVEKNRKWSTKKSIYTQDILQNMPNVIQDKYIECAPKTKLKLLENCF
jgi:hypothetical protein